MSPPRCGRDSETVLTVLAVLAVLAVPLSAQSSTPDDRAMGTRKVLHDKITGRTFLEVARRPTQFVLLPHNWTFVKHSPRSKTTGKGQDGAAPFWLPGTHGTPAAATRHGTRHRPHLGCTPSCHATKPYFGSA